MRDVCQRTGLPCLVKHPSDNRVFSIDYTNLLDGVSLTTNGTLTSTNQSLVTGSGSLTLGTVSRSGTRASFTISGGTDGEDYLLSMTGGDGTNTVTANVILKVRSLL